MLTCNKCAWQRPDDQAICPQCGCDRFMASVSYPSPSSNENFDSAPVDRSYGDRRRPRVQVSQQSSRAEFAPDSQDTSLAVLAHLTGFFSSFVGPLLMYLLTPPENRFAKQQAAEVLNFQINLFILWVVSIFLCFVLIGFLLLPVLGILQVVLPVIGAVKASQGESYRYPVLLRLVR